MVQGAARSAVALLLGAGTLRRYEGRGPIPGERGSGYSAATCGGHIEPQEIYVLGTSHVSARSAREVESVIEALEPDCVVLECCRSRSGLLYADDADMTDGGRTLFGISGDGTPLQVLLRSLSLGGWSALLLRTALVRMSDGVGRQAGVVPGADLRAAKRAADRVNASLVLGDRPIEITLERSWLALTSTERWQLLRLAFDALTSGGTAAAPTVNVSEVIEMAADDPDELQMLEAEARTTLELPAALLLSFRAPFVSAHHSCDCFANLV